MLYKDIEIGEYYATTWGKKVKVLAPTMSSDVFKVRFHGGDEDELSARLLTKTWTEHKETQKREREWRLQLREQAEQTMAFWPVLHDQVNQANEVFESQGLKARVTPGRSYFDQEAQRPAGSARVELPLRDLARLISAASDEQLDQVVRLDVTDDVLTCLVDAHRPAASDPLDLLNRA